MDSFKPRRKIFGQKRDTTKGEFNAVELLDRAGVSWGLRRRCRIHVQSIRLFGTADSCSPQLVCTSCSVLCAHKSTQIGTNCCHEVRSSCLQIGGLFLRNRVKDSLSTSRACIGRGRIKLRSGLSGTVLNQTCVLFLSVTSVAGQRTDCNHMFLSRKLSRSGKAPHMFNDSFLQWAVWTVLADEAAPEDFKRTCSPRRLPMTPSSRSQRGLTPSSSPVSLYRNTSDTGRVPVGRRYIRRVGELIPARPAGATLNRPVRIVRLSSI